MYTYSEFKSFIIQSSIMNGGELPFTESDFENLYKDNCMSQIANFIDTFMGYMIKNRAEMTPLQMYDWMMAIKDFFQINIEKPKSNIIL